MFKYIMVTMVCNKGSDPLTITSILHEFLSYAEPSFLSLCRVFFLRLCVCVCAVCVSLHTFS